MKRAFVAAAAAVTMFALSACGGNAGAAQPSGGSLRKVTVGVIPIVDTAPIYLGVAGGIFKNYGLELDLKSSLLGATGTVPGVVSGQLDFGYGNALSLVTAQSKGLNLKIIAPGSETTGISGHDTSAVVVMANSNLKSPADLGGKTVAVNTVKTLGDTTIRETVSKAGGDASRVKFVEVSFPDAYAALSKGQVDAAWLAEPFLTIAEKQGARILATNFVSTDDSFLLSAYFTSGKLYASDPDVVKRFTAAMKESMALAQSNPDKIRDILHTYMKVAPDVAKDLVLPRFPQEITQHQASFQVDFAYKQGLISAPIDSASLFPVQ